MKRILTPEQKEEDKAKKRAYYQKNRVAFLAACKKRYEERGRAQWKARYYSENRETFLAALRLKRKQNIEVRRAKDRAWYAKNRERHCLMAKMDRINNPEKYRAIDKREYARNREKTLIQLRAFNATPEGKLMTLLRNTCRRVAKLGQVTHPKKKDLLGAPIELVRAHIESQFKEGMTWENHGVHGWHIDHVKPLASFDLTDPEQLKQAAHYTNLAPLWAYDNWSKGAKTA